MKPERKPTEIRNPKTLSGYINGESFEDWHQERTKMENIRKGEHWKNQPDSTPIARRHNPSKLNQCHRKVFYNQLNAPSEQLDPQGIFWIGSKFETELILPYLEEQVARPGEYVQNSIWVDYSVTLDSGEVRIKGSTDPIFVDSQGKPILLTEVKTKSSIDQLDKPQAHHRAQVHAYLYGLSQKFDEKVTNAVLIYGSRTNLSIRAFPVDFDPWFWSNTVLDWAENHTQFRLGRELPPSDPEFDWECKFCQYKRRCGQTDSAYQDEGPLGFLPLYRYPKQKVVAHLEANANSELKLTPTIAHHYPQLVTDYTVHDWKCESCEIEYEWDQPDWSGNTKEPPICSSCRDCVLRGPFPAEQEVN